MSRIINRQRQLAEQGRLRLGYTVPAKTKDGRDTTRPVRSETWILTSHSREHIEHAATLWGGEAHEWEPMGNGAKQWRVITTSNAVPAILPPGDPLTQAYEQWNRGGCVRRCDGVTEELSGSPCICLNQHGEHWYELGPREVCVSKSRLKVLLPDMPGLGSWRMETGSYYATDEIAGMVDTIRGAVGESVLVPVTLRIEPRTRVAGGQTKQFVVPVVELRGVTAGALLSGQAIETRALTAGDPESTKPLALQAPASGDAFTPYFDELAEAASLEQLQEQWSRMVAENLVGTRAPNTPRAQEFLAAFKARAAELKDAAPAEAPHAAAEAEPVVNADGTVDADIVEDPDAVWAEVVKEGGNQGFSLPDLQDHFAQKMGGLSSSEASAAELRFYLENHLKGGEAA